MKDHTFKKTYLCMVEGTIDRKTGTIDLPSSRKNGSIIERCVDSSGQPSKTVYEVMKEYENYSFVKCILETGRTHQIRVHFSYIGHPLLGDTLYGTKSDLISHTALICSEISFYHPFLNKTLTFSVPLSNDFKKIIK